MNLTERFLRGARVYEGKLLQVHRDIVTTSDGREQVREVIRHPGAAVVVPHLGNEHYLVVRQFRYALNLETVEFPAGRLDAGEDALVCARRELTEETGYSAQRWRRLFSMHPAPGYTDELLEIFLADGLEPGASRPDDDEQILMEEASLDELTAAFLSGQITDSKTAAAILYLQAFPEYRQLP